MKVRDQDAGEKSPLKKSVAFGNVKESKSKGGKNNAPSSSANERLIKQWRSMDSQEELINKLKINDSAAAFLGFIGTMVAIVENNILFEETPVKPRYV